MTEVTEKKPMTVAEAVAQNQKEQQEANFRAYLYSLTNTADSAAARAKKAEGRMVAMQEAHDAAMEKEALKASLYQTLFDKVLAITTEETTSETSSFAARVFSTLDYGYYTRQTIIDYQGVEFGNQIADFLDLPPVEATAA
jgi:hypothetical protein